MSRVSISFLSDHTFYKYHTTPIQSSKYHCFYQSVSKLYFGKYGKKRGKDVHNVCYRLKT